MLIACPLQSFTRKDTLFEQSADRKPYSYLLIKIVKTKLLTSPALGYPDFNKDFTLETNASKHGLCTISLKCKEDRQLHPLVYASQSVSTTEPNYAITDCLRNINCCVGSYTLFTLLSYMGMMLLPSLTMWH